MTDKKQKGKSLLAKVKENFKPLSVGGVTGAGLFYLLSPFFVPTAVEQITPVRLKPIGNNGGVLKVDQSNRCKKDQHPGCLHFAKDTKAYMGFYVFDEDPGKTCDTGAKRVISKIELATKEDMQDARKKHSKGDFAGGVDTWLTKAFKSIDQKTGIIYEAKQQPGWTQVVLENLNNHNAEEGVKRFWYEVTVTKCGDQKIEWTTDPRGDNEGKN